MIDTSARPDTSEQQERRRLLLAMAKAGQFKGVTPRLLPAFLHPDRLNDKELVAELREQLDSLASAAFATLRNWWWRAYLMCRSENRRRFGSFS